VISIKLTFAGTYDIDVGDKLIMDGDADAAR
jgi:hypothetical protein